MASNTINLLDEGGIHGCDCTKNIQNLCPLLPLGRLNAFLLGKQIDNNQLLLICPNNVWPVNVWADWVHNP